MFQINTLFTPSHTYKHIKGNRLIRADSHSRSCCCIYEFRQTTFICYFTVPRKVERKVLSVRQVRQVDVTAVTRCNASRCCAWTLTLTQTLTRKQSHLTGGVHMYALCSEQRAASYPQSIRDCLDQTRCLSCSLLFLSVSHGSRIF